MKSPKRPSIFVVLNFVTATSPRGSSMFIKECGYHILDSLLKSRLGKVTWTYTDGDH